MTQRSPSSFWLHVVGGLLIGGSILYWCHSSDLDFAVVSVFAFLFVGVAYATKRSSWAVLGTIGFFAATSHYVTDRRWGSREDSRLAVAAGVRVDGDGGRSAVART
jgi:hypothetical protein